MQKQVIVIASGATERAALPFLTKDIQQESIDVEVLIPPRNGAMTADVIERILKSAWYGSLDNRTPDKFVVLLDADGKDPDTVLEPLRRNLHSDQYPNITVPILLAYAQWHLEAWFFGDSQNLRDYLERDLGSVDASNPDDIDNPKRHLKHLLAGNYTRRTSEAIARVLNPQTIISRSPSFRGFIDAVRNGDG